MRSHLILRSQLTENEPNLKRSLALISLAHNTKLLQRLTLCLRPAHLHHCIIYLVLWPWLYVVTGLREWGLSLEAGQGRVQSWVPDGFHCSEAPLQPRGDTLALQSHNQNNWEEQDGEKMKKREWISLMADNHVSKREQKHASIRWEVSGLGSSTRLHPCSVTLE